jgi:hypothetical protein
MIGDAVKNIVCHSDGGKPNKEMKQLRLDAGNCAGKIPKGI